MAFRARRPEPSPLVSTPVRPAPSSLLLTHPFCFLRFPTPPCPSFPPSTLPPTPLPSCFRSRQVKLAKDGDVLHPAGLFSEELVQLAKLLGKPADWEGRFSPTEYDALRAKGAVRGAGAARAAAASAPQPSPGFNARALVPPHGARTPLATLPSCHLHPSVTSVTPLAMTSFPSSSSSTPAQAASERMWGGGAEFVTLPAPTNKCEESFGRCVTQLVPGATLQGDGSIDDVPSYVADVFGGLAHAVLSLSYPVRQVRHVCGKLVRARPRPRPIPSRSLRRSSDLRRFLSLFELR